MQKFKEFIISKLNDAVNRLEQDKLFPNLEWPTLGGTIFWKTLAEKNNWRLQLNRITGHARILDAEDIRHFWGSERVITKLFTEMATERKK